MNAPTTLIVNIGDDADPAVTEALCVLLETLKDGKKELVQLKNDEATFSHHELKKFLLDSGIATDKQAASFASRAVEALLSKFLENARITAICQNCGKVNGQCKCEKSGYSAPQGLSAASTSVWEYMEFPQNWRITHASFLQLTDIDFRKLSKQSGSRLKRFQEYLRTQT